MNKLLVAAPLVLVACTPRPEVTIPAPPPDPLADVAKRSPDPEPAPVTPLPQAQGTPSKDLIPRAVLFGNPERTNVQLSHDGTQLAWLAPKDGVMNLWVAPVGALDTANVVTSDTKRPIRQYAWAYTNQHLVYVQDSGGDENFHVFKVDLAGGTTTDLTPVPGARANLDVLSHTKPGSITVTMNDRDPKIMEPYEIDLATGKRTPLLHATGEELVDYVIDRKDLTLKYAMKLTADGSMTILRPAAKTAKEPWITVDTVPFEDTETSEVIAMAPDGKTVYARDSRGRDTAAFVQVEIGGKAAPKVLADDAKADAGPVLFHPTKRTPQAIAFNYQRLAWKLLDKSLAPDFAVLDKLVPGAVVGIASRSLDDKTWLVTTTSPEKPRDFYLYSRAKKQATFLFSAQPALGNQPLVAMWPQTIKARDGMELVAYLTLPKGADRDNDGKADRPVPLVLAVHGGPWARDAWGYNPYHQLFANRGYATLSVNFRGSTGFGKKYVNAGNLQWSKAMHDDLVDAVAWAIDQKLAPKDKVCIMGGSYGGYATLVGLAMTPELFACGVDVVGPSNLLTLLATIPPYWAPIRTTFYKRVGNPETAEGKALLVAASPLTHAKAIRRPLLIAQGANDPRVKQAESEQIVAAMKAAKLPVTYALFPDEGHGFARPENNIVFVGLMEAFLSAHLGGMYAPLSGEELAASSLVIKDGKNGIPGL